MISEEKQAMGNEHLTRKKVMRTETGLKKPVFTKPGTCLNHETNQEIFETKCGEENAYL